MYRDDGLDHLVLVTVPPTVASYAVCDSRCMRLAHAAYWMSLANHQLIPDGPDQPGSVTVKLPVHNLLTPQKLVALVETGDVEGVS